MTYYYRLAVLPQDAERIHQLNYQTFVEEIPQHPSNENRLLVDSFHEENTYVLCVKEDEIVGMTALRTARPFSLDKKVGAIENVLEVAPAFPVEIRLLVVDRAHRQGRAFFGLLQALAYWCKKAGHDVAVISGTVRELKLYRRMGFLPFAEPVGTEVAKYVPMVLTLAAYEESAAKRLVAPVVNFLPGPVKIAANVQAAFSSEPFSHRSPVYARLLRAVEQQLTLLTGANFVNILQGTGTLANDAVAAQLSRIEGSGLILVNGEFGQRLCDHAERFGLSFDSFEIAWGESFSSEELTQRVDAQKYQWLWFVHGETSTGVLNELGRVTEICQARGIRVAIDCASSLGVVPVDLGDVDFASSVSGKGLMSYAGLGLVFHKRLIKPDLSIPRYLDIGQYNMQDGIPYTQSSNVLGALHQSLTNLMLDTEGVFQRIQTSADQLRAGVERLGLTVLSPKDASNTGILTLVVPAGKSSKRVGDNLFLNGYCTHYESNYLQEKNWLQLATMNQPSAVDVEKFLEVLAFLLSDESVKS